MSSFFARWFALMLSAMPVAFTLAVASVLWLLSQGMSLASVTQRLVAGVDSFVLLAVLEIRLMKEHGYPASFAGALTCASCIIGPLVPPSIPMVLYGMVANVSVGALFLGGIVPGVLTAVVLMVYGYFWARKRGIHRDPPAPWAARLTAARGAPLPLMAPLIILGGIFGGVFTPTEAAGVAALYALFLGGLVYRTLPVAGDFFAKRSRYLPWSARWWPAPRCSPG